MNAPAKITLRYAPRSYAAGDGSLSVLLTSERRKRGDSTYVRVGNERLAYLVRRPKS